MGGFFGERTTAEVKIRASILRGEIGQHQLVLHGQVRVLPGPSTDGTIASVLRVAAGARGSMIDAPSGAGETNGPRDEALRGRHHRLASTPHRVPRLTQGVRPG